tara:strand:- start:4918 stop:5793 length:876 start_codon:yes stop_codon:yes gene_type:complete
MFSQEVNHVSQQMASNLQGAVRTVRGVVGSTYKFPVMGKAGYTVNKPAGDDLDVMSSSAYGSLGTTAHATNEYKVGGGTSAASFETATLKAYATGEYADNIESLFTNVDLRSAYAESIAAAMGRAYDQVIIDALDAAKDEGGLAATKANAVDLNRNALIAAHKALNAKNVPMNDRYLLIDPNGLEDILLNDSNLITAQDGPLSNALVSGQVANVMGFNVIVSNQLSDGTTASADVLSYAFHKNAIGMAIGQDLKTEVNYVPEKLATLISAQFSAGAVSIDNSMIYAMEVNR